MNESEKKVLGFPVNVLPDTGEHLLDAVNETSKVARSSLLFLLVVALYLLIIAGITSDVVLLKGDIVALPLMQVDIPVVAFYIAAPPLFWMLHVNLLIRLRQLASTVKLWETHAKGNLDPKVQKSLVFPFDFVRLLLKDDMRWVLQTVVFIQLNILPITVLIILQMKFLAYQESGITFFHQFITTADVVFLLYITGAFDRELYSKIDNAKLPYPLKTSLQKSIATSVAIIVLIWVWLIAVVPDSWQETSIYVLVITALLSIFFLLYMYKIKHKNNKKTIALKIITLLLTLFLIFIIDGLFFKKISVYQQNTSALMFADRWNEEWGNKWTSPFPQRYLDVQLKSIVPINERRQSLKNRQLRYVELNNSILIGAILEKVDLLMADLRGANLSKAILVDTDLIDAKLHSVNLEKAYLSGVDLSRADLTNTSLIDAKLHSINLRGANLSGVILSEADLSEADLSRADLGRAYFRGARLYGINLADVTLNANTKWCSREYRQLCAELQYVDISGANVPPTSFYPLPELQNPHCVLYDAVPYFAAWNRDHLNCAETVRNDTDIVCEMLEATKGIVDMAIRMKDEDEGAFILALLNKKDCPALEEYKEKLRAARKK